MPWSLRLLYLNSWATAEARLCQCRIGAPQKLSEPAPPACPAPPPAAVFPTEQLFSELCSCSWQLSTGNTYGNSWKLLCPVLHLLLWHSLLLPLAIQRPVFVHKREKYNQSLPHPVLHSLHDHEATSKGMKRVVAPAYPCYANSFPVLLLLHSHRMAGQNLALRQHKHMLWDLYWQFWEHSHAVNDLVLIQCCKVKQSRIPYNLTHIRQKQWNS